MLNSLSLSLFCVGKVRQGKVRYMLHARNCCSPISKVRYMYVYNTFLTPLTNTHTHTETYMYNDKSFLWAFLITCLSCMCFCMICR